MTSLRSLPVPVFGRTFYQDQIGSPISLRAVTHNLTYRIYQASQMVSLLFEGAEATLVPHWHLLVQRIRLLVIRSQAGLQALANIVTSEEPFLTGQVNDRLAFLQVAIQKHRFELLLIGDKAHVPQIVDALYKCRRTVGIELILRRLGR